MRDDLKHGKDYYRPGTQSYLDWLPVLVKRLEPYGLQIKKITEWQYRINGVLDLYPVNRRFHDLKKNRRGDYNDFVSFTLRFFRIPNTHREGGGNE